MSIAGRDAIQRRNPWWRVPFAAETWRRTLYALVALPVGLACLPLAIFGGSPAAARLQHALARTLLAARLDEPRYRRTDWRVISLVALSIPLGVASLAVTAYLWLLVPMNIAFPLRVRDPGDLANSWGGPTLAGAWAVHGAAGLAFLFVTPWVVKGITSLQGRLVRRFLGSAAPRSRPTPRS